MLYKNQKTCWNSLWFDYGKIEWELKCFSFGIIGKRGCYLYNAVMCGAGKRGI